MSNISIAVLTGRSVVQIHGGDVQDFMQGLVTGDMRKVTQSNGIHAALLSPQGKILFDFFIIADDEGYLLDVPASQSADLLKRLSMYKLRSKVEITDMSDKLGVAVCWPGRCHIEGAASYGDPRLEQLGIRLIAGRARLDALMASAGAKTAGENDYHAHRIKLGVAEGGQDFGSGEVYPHEANLDQLNGVSFTKGCYVGQEVVSRMRHKTQIRKRFVPVHILDGGVETAAPVLADGKSAGVMGSCSGDLGMALLRFDRVENTAELTCNGVQLVVLQPEWADFLVPGGAIS